jgi:hypothetical protein
VLGWLFVAVLGIIWAVFLLPYLRRGGSPVSSVEEFERKMEFLAETNRGPRGRWVLTPRKEARFLRPRDRHRSRIVHRRRRILAGLAEAAALALLIGMFPPFHGLLVAAAILGGLLLLYTALLVRIRVREAERARRARARRARSLIARPAPLRERVAAPASNGAANASVATSRPAAESYGFDGYAGGWTGYPTGRVAGGPRDEVPGPDDEVRVVIDDDVHLVVRRPQSVVLGELDAAAR